MWMLDTDTCSYFLKAHPESLKVRIEKAGLEQLAISTVVLAELFFGAARHPRGAEIRSGIDEFSARLSVFPWDKAAAEHYGQIRSRMEQQGTPMGNMDMMIAAHARSLNAVLVTNNVRHFRRVPGLTVENWI